MIDFTKDIKALDMAAAMRSHILPQLTLQTFIGKLKDESRVINAMIDGNKQRSVAENVVRDFVAGAIVAAADGCLAVKRYSQKSKAKQTIYLFVGTHWEMLKQQVYYDFVKDSAKKMGLSDIFSENQEFMNQVFESVAFRVARERDVFVPEDMVRVNFQNGTLEITSDGRMRLCEHRRDDFFTYCLPYAFDKNAECPMWEMFLDRVMPEKEMQTLLAEYIGYCFTRNLKLEKMAVFYGMGANGKSVTMDVIMGILGAQNVSNVSLSALTNDDLKRALIDGKMLNVSHESGAKVEPSILKQLISGEPTEARVLYEGPVTLYNIPKLITSFNRLPSSESTYGYFRRWILFPFNVTIPDEEQDPMLTKKLYRELPGILNWVLSAMEGLLSRKAFTRSEACERALNEYRRESNTALTFLAERCEISEKEVMRMSDLYNAYCRYCESEGITKRMQKRGFREVLKNFGCEETVKHNQYYFNVVCPF